MQFECSEEEIVRIVRRREGYSLWKSFWASPLSKGLIISTSLLFGVGVVFSVLELPSIISTPPIAAAALLYGILSRRLFTTCRKDARKLIVEIVKDSIRTDV